MNVSKFGADLIIDGTREGGKIVITDTNFFWQPLFGAVTEIPIEDVEGYKKKGTTLILGFKGLDQLMTFYTWKGQSIIDAISSRNPSFRMYRDEEIHKSGCLSILIVFIIGGVLSLLINRVV